MIRTRIGYTLFLYLLLPYIGLRLVWRGRKQPGYRQQQIEKNGIADACSDHTVNKLSHAASTAVNCGGAPAPPKLMACPLV